MNCYLPILGSLDLLGGVWAVVGVLLGALFTVPFFYLIHLLISLPLRRRERGMVFLDLLERGLERGRSIRDTIESLVKVGDPRWRNKLALLKMYLESGDNLTSALRKAPGIVPRQFIPVLDAGVESGDVANFFPACRTLLQEDISQVRGIHHFLIYLFHWPLMLLLLIYLNGGRPFNVFPYLISDMNIDISYNAEIAFAVAALLFLAIVIFWVMIYLRPYSFGMIFDRLEMLCPWSRKRRLRDFVLVLAVLLENGADEQKALQAAAFASGNRMLQDRAMLAVAMLATGVPLPQAMTCIDKASELQWRLKNARHGKFVNVVKGWVTWLETKAFAQEQAAAQLLTSLVIIADGVVVALLTFRVFGLLITLMERGGMW